VIDCRDLAGDRGVEPGRDETAGFGHGLADLDRILGLDERLGRTAGVVGQGQDCLGRRRQGLDRRVRRELAVVGMNAAAEEFHARLFVVEVNDISAPPIIAIANARSRGGCLITKKKPIFRDWASEKLTGAAFAH
jgi:hypothetical protein